MTTAEATERKVERWLYGGVRERQGKRYDCFISEDGKEHWFGGLKGRVRLALGYWHEAKTDPEGAVYGTPQYAGERADDETVLRLTAADSAARQKLEELRLVRKAGGEDAIRKALEDAGLIKLMKEQRSEAARAALLAKVNLILARSW